MDGHAISTALQEVQGIVTSIQFEEWRKEFVRQNLEAFDYGDENKLIYTDIHKEYESEIEKRIASELSVNITSFMAALPAYLEGEGKYDEAAGKAITLLMEASDFIQFRDMMMFIKREIEDKREAKASGDDDETVAAMTVKGKELADFEVAEMMTKCAELSTAASSDEGWTNVLTLDWMKIDKKPVEV